MKVDLLGNFPFEINKTIVLIVNLGVYECFFIISKQSIDRTTELNKHKKTQLIKGETMKCQFCDQDLPDGAKFCFKCNKQIVCKECGEMLLSNSSICVFCGAEISSRSQTNGMNHIRYTETESGKSFEASFSDETAGNVVETFARFLPHNKIPITQRKSLSPSITEDIEVEEVKDVLNDKNINNKNESSTATGVDKIFTAKGDVILLSEKRLKSNSTQDQQARITLLFMLYKKTHQEIDVKRSELNAILKKEGLYDANFRAWLSTHKSLFIIDDVNKTLELSSEGQEEAQKILLEVFDTSVEGTWNPNRGTSNKSNPKPLGNAKSAQIVKDLNLMPKDKMTLDDFMAQYSYGKSARKINLLFIYYLKETLKISQVNQNHVFTCYRHMKISVPNNLYQCLADTISKNGWIENLSDLSITIQGLNEVEQKMKKK